MMNLLPTIVVLSLLLPKGCHSWTGPAPRRKVNFRVLGIDSSSRLYYKTNVTSDSFSSRRPTSSAASSSSSKNQTTTTTTVDLEDYGSEFDLLFSATKRSRKESSSIRQIQPRRNDADLQEESVHHAIEQVHAIMDLYELTKSISTDIITTTLDGVIQKVFKDKAHMANNNNTNSKDDNGILNELEGLVWRLGELNIPLDSIMALKAMLSMQRHKYEAASLESKRAYIDRAAKLLLYYCQGGSQEQVVDDQQPLLERRFRWPHEDTRGVLRFAQFNKVGMTPHLWDLYHYVRTHDPDDTFVREITGESLHILADSEEEAWMERQYDILVGLEDRYQATNSTLYLVRDHEFDLALSTAATAGHAQQATWLFRRLYSRQHLSADRRQLWYLLIKAYAQSNLEGSVSYLERLVRSQEETQHRDIVNMVLKEIAKQGAPGAGVRAKTFLNDMVCLTSDEPKKAKTLHPDMESLCHCVTAYLDEKPRVLQNVLDADALVRRFSSTYNRTTYNQDKYSSGNRPVFERLLEAYASHAPEDPRAIKAAEHLLRFYLLQHRGGKVTERPSAKHLEYILQALNQKPNKRNAETSLEFFRLFQKLENTPYLDKSCTKDNLNILVDTLSKSGLNDLANAMKDNQQEHSGNLAP